MNATTTNSNRTALINRLVERKMSPDAKGRTLCGWGRTLCSYGVAPTAPARQRALCTAGKK